jgi:two-component system cell cycle sensor histidine kinase/response regulator CckA
MTFGEVILLAEDDDSVRDVITRALRKHGYRIVAAEDGLAAARMAETLEEQPALLLTDVAMPGLSGPELASRLLAHWPSLKVLFVTAYAGEHAVKLVTAGRDVLPKPFTNDQLLSRVKAAIAGTPSS